MSLEWRARSASLVWSNPGLVVGFPDRGQRREYRDLGAAVPAAPQSRPAISAAPPASRSCCSSLRPMRLAAPSARSFRARTSSGSACSTMAFERCRRPLGRDGGRGLLRGAVGDHPASARHDDGRGAPPLNVAWVIVPLIYIAECFSWYAVLTRHYPAQRHRELAMGRRLLHCRRWPLLVAAEFDGAVRVILVITIIGIAATWRFS